MSDLFLRCVRFSLSDRIEGGFISEAAAARIGDRGGATNRGVARAFVQTIDRNGDGVLDFDLDGDGDVDESDIRALDGHPELVHDFYRHEYWNRVRADQMPFPWCLLAFDAAINHGVAGASVLLQRAVGARADGQVGTKTLAAIRTSTPDAVVEYVAQRGRLFALLYAKDERRPILGWNRRLALLHKEAGSEA